MALTNHLNQNEIPHNVVIVKCRPFRNGEPSEIGSDKITIRVHVWPRKSSYGNFINYQINLNKIHFIQLMNLLIKKDCPPNDRGIAYAICEMAGHFLLKGDFLEDLNSIFRNFNKIVFS